MQICVYLGPTEDDPRTHAETMFSDAGLHTRPAVLLLVSPREHRIEVVTSSQVRGRVSDQTCSKVVELMAPYFGRSDIAGGIVAGIRQLQTAIGPTDGAPTADTFPNVIEHDAQPSHEPLPTDAHR